jgi:peptidoglycan hydrolase CwlO-like protein
MSEKKIMKEILNQLNTLSNNVNNLDNKVSSLDNKVSSLDNKVSSLDNKVSSLESEMNKRFDEVDKRFDLVENNIKFLMKRANSVESQTEIIALQVNENNQILKESNVKEWLNLGSEVMAKLKQNN